MRADIKLYNMDCMDALREIPDNAFDLAIVDPPYGKSVSGGYTHKSNNGKKRGISVARQKNYHHALWSQDTPKEEYFIELKRVSINQIIWGANHLCGYSDLSSSGWIFWNKKNGDVKFSDGEVAYTSFKKGLRMFEFMWSGMLQENMKEKEIRIHPTQKPVQLYKWLLQNYAKLGNKIIDTHLGSGSIAIACWDMGFDLTGYEIDADYYNSAVKRLERHQAQGQLF